MFIYYFVNSPNVKSRRKIRRQTACAKSNPKKMTYDEILSEMIKDGIQRTRALKLLSKKPDISLLRSENI